jgi:signal recognition particle receptor subunit beta
MSQTVNKYEQLKLPFGSGAIEHNYTLMDMPGHPKLYYMTENAIDANRTNINGIIYMIDAASGAAGVSEAANGLYRLLQQTEKRSGGVPILVAASKSDVFNVVSAARLKTVLEDEINQLRSAKAQSVGDVKINAQGQDTGEHGDEGYWIGLEGKFEFAQLEGEVAVLDGSVKAGRTAKWESWVDQQAANH